MAEPTSPINGMHSSAAPERDALYYLTPITIQVEDTLFKVPRVGFIQNSPVFRDMFSIPQTEGSTSTTEGLSDTNPVKLPVDKGDFRRLLEVIYPLDIPPDPSMPKEGWIAVLRLAKMWEMSTIRALAIGRLSAIGMGSVEKIVLAKEFHVPQWLRAGYQELVDQTEMPSVEDCDKIGYPSAIRVLRMREGRLRGRYSGYGYSGYSQGLTLTVESEFKEELATEDAFHQTYTSYTQTIESSLRKSNLCHARGQWREPGYLIDVGAKDSFSNQVRAFWCFGRAAYQTSSLMTRSACKKYTVRSRMTSTAPGRLTRILALSVVPG